LVTPSFDKISELGKRKILPANVGYSRIYLGAHWPSDVIATLFLGISEALLLLGLFELIWKTAARRWTPYLSFEVHRRANAEREDWKASCLTRWQNWPPPLSLLGPTVAGIANPATDKLSIRDSFTAG
jgi:membrane-associated phospholipid phosphatase